MKIKISAILMAMLIFVLAACGGVTGGEPAADDLPGNDETPTAVPAEPTDAGNEVLMDTATVESIQINIMESFPVQVSVQVSGYLGDGCTELAGVETTQDGNTFEVSVITQRPADAICTQQLVAFDENVSLDVAGLPAGTYTVNVNGVTDTFELQMDNALPGAPVEETGELTAEAVTELLRLTLERALVAQEIPDYALLTDQDPIVLSTENVDPALVPEIEGVALMLMTPEEIQAKADAEGDFPYLRFQQVTAVSDNEARVSLGSSWAIAADSDMLYLSGGGFTIEYTRTADGWTGEITEAWIS